MLENIKQYALVNNVPIMQEDGIEFLIKFIKEKNIKTILEIGSAIGYSAIKMALIDSDIKIITIERDELRYKEAVNNINELNLSNQITIYNIDAFDYEISNNFDLLFIDAAKSQNEKFFAMFADKCKFIITDNLNFHGLTNNKEKINSKNLKALIRKIENYIQFLKENKEYKTIFLDVGDGISISEKYEEN